MSKSRAAELAEKYGFQPEVGVDGETLDATAQSFLFRAIVDFDVDEGDYEEAVKLAKYKKSLDKQVYLRYQKAERTKHDIPDDKPATAKKNPSIW